jgi:hypothetical protein
MFLRFACLIICAPVVCAQHAGAENSGDDCGGPIPDTQDAFCASILRGLANTLDPYGTENPGILREKYATHSVCAMCPCGVDPVVPESDPEQLERIREFLSVSPETRLTSAIKAGDLRPLAAPKFSGHYVPCYGDRENSAVLHVMPQTFNVEVSDEHAELNRRVFFYARQYNHLLVSWLVCSEEMPLPEASLQRLGIECTK